MNEDLLEMALRRISELEKKLELYYELLKIDNEISFVLNGSYIFEEDLEKIINGTY